MVRVMMRDGEDEKMGWVGGCVAQAEVEPPALHPLARKTIERQPLNPYRKMTLIPIPSWRLGSMVESDR
jgi:hypothetical protein